MSVKLFKQYLYWGRMYEQFYFLMQCNIPKQNNFKQPGERYRSWAPDRFLLQNTDMINMNCVWRCLIFGFLCHNLFRQDRFLRRWVDALSDPRVTHEIRSIWISYWSQVRFRHANLSN